MALGGELQILPPVKDTADGLAALFGGHGHLTAQNGGKRLLAAETTAGHILMDVDISRAAVQRPHHRAVNVVGTLHGAVDEHPPAFLRLGHHALRLQIRLILIAGLKFLFIDLVGLGKGLVDIALFVLVVEKDFIGLAEIQHRLQFFVFHLDAAENVLTDRLVRAADHADGLADVLHSLPCIDRRVVHDDVHIVVAGYVVAINVVVAIRQLRHLDGQQLRPRIFGAEHFAAENTMLVDVADVNGTSLHLGCMVFLHDRVGNGMQCRFLLFDVIPDTAAHSGNTVRMCPDPSSSPHRPPAR